MSTSTAAGPMSIKAWRSVLRADPCTYCGQSAERMEVDHIVPTSSYASPNDWMNWTAACRACNRRKKSRSLLSVLTGLQIGANPEFHVEGIHFNFTKARAA